MKLKDLSLIFMASLAGLLFTAVALCYKFFIENAVLMWASLAFILIWIIKFAITQLL